MLGVGVVNFLYFNKFCNSCGNLCTVPSLQPELLKRALHSRIINGYYKGLSHLDYFLWTTYTFINYENKSSLQVISLSQMVQTKS